MARAMSYSDSTTTNGNNPLERQRGLLRLANALPNDRATAPNKHQNGNPGALGCRFGFYNQLRAGARQLLWGVRGELAKHRDFNNPAGAV